MLYSTYGGTSKASRCGPDCILLARKGVSEGWMLNHPTKYRWGERVGRVNNAIQPDDQKSETGPMIVRCGLHGDFHTRTGAAMYSCTSTTATLVLLCVLSVRSTTFRPRPPSPRPQTFCAYTLCVCSLTGIFNSSCYWTARLPPLSMLPKRLRSTAVLFRTTL